MSDIWKVLKEASAANAVFIFVFRASLFSIDAVIVDVTAASVIVKVNSTAVEDI